MRGSSALIGAALALGSCSVARAQDAGHNATIEVVRLDVVVTDARGAPVKGLVRDDFDVREDGKAQPLTNFAFLTSPGQVSAAGPSTSPGGTAATLEVAPSPARYIVIVVDELHLSRRSVAAAKAVLRRFVGEHASPEDQIALVVVGKPSAAIQPTRDRAALRQAIERIVARADEDQEGEGRQLTVEQAELILRGDAVALKLATRLLRDEPGFGADLVDPSGRLAAGVSPRERATTSDPTPAGIEPSERGAALMVQEQARAIHAEALSLSSFSLGTLEDALRGMAPLAGRRLCLFVSDGPLVGRGTSDERTRLLQQVADAATRAGVAVYALVAGGVVPLGGGASQPGSAGPAGLREQVARAGQRLPLETLQSLADDTGGLVFKGGDDIADGLGRMLRDDESVYLLAYEPTNRKRDGRFRRIEVRLPRHGDFVARTRRGYFAPGGRERRQQARTTTSLAKNVTGSPGSPRMSSADAWRALDAAPLQSGVVLGVAADYVEPTPGRPQAIVKAQVDPQGLQWRQVEGRQRAEFDLIGGVYDVRSRPLQIFAGNHYVLDLGPADYDKLRQTGVRFEAQLPLPPGQYQIRLLALDAGRAPLGGAARVLQVPDLAQQKLTLSSVFLSSSAASEGPAPSSEAGGAPRDAQALRRFKTSDSLYFQVYVYNAARDAAGASDVLLQSQILSPQWPPFASKPRPALLREQDGVVLPDGDGVPLLGLHPGRYELRVVVEDRKAKAVASRSIDFTIVE